MPDDDPKNALALAVPDIPVDESMTLLARTPQEMESAKERLLGWVQGRLARSQRELQETEENLALAKRRKWATQGWTRQVRVARSRMQFYEKCVAAVEAGYSIVPDFPTDIFAIRTARRSPKPNRITRTGWVPTPQDQTPDGVPLGEGEYVSPHTYTEMSSTTVVDQDAFGKERSRQRMTSWATEYIEPDFPIKAVKPAVLGALDAAMRRKIFDDFGVLPARTRRADPIITGRIIRLEGSRRISLCFMVAWWLDLEDV